MHIIDPTPVETAFAVLELTTVKIIASVSLSIFFFLFGELYVQALIAVAMLMVFDTILGVAATYSEGMPITSRRFSRVLVKGILYFTAISAGYFADLTVPFDLIQATMIAFVGVTEFISILENVGRMGYETPKKLLNQLRDFKNKQ